MGIILRSQNGGHRHRLIHAISIRLEVLEVILCLQSGDRKRIAGVHGILRRAHDHEDGDVFCSGDMQTIIVDLIRMVIDIRGIDIVVRGVPFGRVQIVVRRVNLRRIITKTSPRTGRYIRCG